MNYGPSPVLYFNQSASISSCSWKMFYKSLLICALCLPAVLSLEFIFGERKENDVALLNVTKKYKFDSPAKLYEIVHQYSPESAVSRVGFSIVARGLYK